MVSSTNYIGYPPDLPWNVRDARTRYAAADVVHLHHNYSAHKLIGMRRPRPHLIHYHGTGFREEPAAYIREQRHHGGSGLVSTLDLYLLAPNDTQWLPSPVNVEALQAMKQPGDSKIVIAHAPTNRAIKSTEEFLQATDQLQSEGYPIEVELIENRPWSECLERKARADIYFDQVQLGYGCNALEAWGMGIPVVAGAADPTLDEMERRFGHLPFYHATPGTIYEALRDMVDSPELRQRYAGRGLEYVRTYHDEKVVAEQLKRLYQDAYDTFHKRNAA